MIGEQHKAMWFRKLQLTAGVVAGLAMLGCFVACALEGTGEHGCEDECTACACDTALHRKPCSGPAEPLLVKGRLGPPLIAVRTIGSSAATVISSCPPHLRCKPPERLFELYASYLI